jgi:protein-disulfide isomerase
MGKKKRRKEKDAGAAGGGSDMSKFYMVLGAVAVLGIGAVGYSVGSNALSPAVAEPIDMQEIQGASQIMELARGMTKGDEDAPITIIEFGDYQCPGCGMFASGIEPQIEAAYVETGQAKFVFYDLPLINIHPNAFLAARAARCAGDQDGFWEYHKMLFSQQNNWSGAANPVGRFVDYAERLGLDADGFEACVRSDAHAEAVTAGIRLAEMMRVSSTPTVIVGGSDGMPRRLSSYGFDDVKAAVEELQAADGAR